MPDKAFLNSRLYQIIIVVAWLSFSGCVQTEHPLSEAGKAIIDPELVGDWILHDKAFGEHPMLGIHITLTNKDIYHVESFRAEPNDAYEARLIEADGNTYLEIQTIDGKQLPQDGTSFSPSFLRFERKGDWIALRTPNASAFRNHVLTATEITGKVDGSYPTFVTISSKADALAKFLSKHGDTVLDQRVVYRRVSKP